MPEEPPSPILAINFVGNTPVWRGVFKQDLRRFLKSSYAALEDVPYKASMGILLGDDDILQKMNKQFRSIDRSTNVLSFPQDYDVRKKSSQYIGDIAIAYETIHLEACKEEKIFFDHLYHITLHGLLHCLQYSHDEEQEAILMESKEIELLKKYHINNPYEG